MVMRAVKKASMRNGKERSQMKVRRRCGGWPAGVICEPLVLAAAQSLMVCGGREETASGLRKIMMKLRTAAAMNRPNIQWEAMRAKLRGSSISLGRATVDWLTWVVQVRGERGLLEMETYY